MIQYAILFLQGGFSLRVWMGRVLLFCSVIGCLCICNGGVVVLNGWFVYVMCITWYCFIMCRDQ